MTFFDFLGHYWWLVFPLMGVGGAVLGRWDQLARRRHERRLEMLRAQGRLAAAPAAAPPPVEEDQSDAARIERLMAAHDAVTHRWLEYEPGRMHRAKRPEMFEEPKIVIQRIRGANAIRASIDRTGTYVGHTCTVVCPRGEPPIPLQRVLELICSPLVDGVTLIERGRRLDLYPRDVAAFPVPQAWLRDASLPLDRSLGLVPADVKRLEAVVSR